MQITEEIREKILVFQRLEITEYHIYKRLAGKIKSPENAKIVAQIAEDELRHYEGLKKYSGQDIQPTGSPCGRITSSAVSSVLPLASSSWNAVKKECRKIMTRSPQ